MENISPSQPTGVLVPASTKVLDVRAAVEAAVAKAIPAGRTKALVGIGRVENGRFVGEVAWVQKINETWSITAGLGAQGTKVRGEILLGGSWK